MKLYNFESQRIPKLQQQDQSIWWDTLAKMQKLFRKASISLFNSGKIDKDTMHNYYMSGIEKLDLCIKLITDYLFI